MPDHNPESLDALEGAQLAYERVADAIEAVSEDALSPQNLDLTAALSVAVAVAPNVAPFRDRIARLAEFDLRNVDLLSDYAWAAWYLRATNLPTAQAANPWEDQVKPLRDKLLMWAVPLARSGVISQAAIDKIREGAGMKQSASDLVSLASVYRGSWEQVRAICGVTEEDLERASRIGPAVYSDVCRREQQRLTPSQSALRLRKAWTLLDRAYGQCRRAIAYLRYSEADVDTILPNLRRNAGKRRGVEASATVQASPEPAAGAVVPLGQGESRN